MIYFFQSTVTSDTLVKLMFPVLLFYSFRLIATDSCWPLAYHNGQSLTARVSHRTVAEKKHSAGGVRVLSMLRYVTPRYAVLPRGTPCYPEVRRLTPRYAVLPRGTPCYPEVRRVTRCYSMLGSFAWHPTGYPRNVRHVDEKMNETRFQ